MGLTNPPPETVGALNEFASAMQGRPYMETSFWSEEDQVKDNLRRAGYLSSTVSMEAGLPRKESDQYLVPLNAIITCGPKYHVSSIRGDGGPLLEGRDLSPFFTLKAGDVALPNPFGKLIGSLRSLYWHSGYADVEFTGEPILDKNRGLASYRLAVVPGPVYHLRNLKFFNLTAEEEALTRGMLGMKAGDVYDALAVSNLSRKLSASESSLKGATFSFTPAEDKENHLVDLTLTFYKPTK